jgi:hypothetical protein
MKPWAPALLVVCFFILFISCKTQQAAETADLVEVVEEESEPAEEKPVEEPVQEEPQEPVAEEPAEPEEPEETEEQEEAEETEVAADFQVSEEVYTETFEDIRKIIDELNAIIREENYDEWLKYLAREYIDHFSSAEVLRENSEQPLLKKYGIRLNNLRDYFRYVVAPSRANARLDDLVFIDNEHVKAIMIIKEQRTILYQLAKIDGVWKIGL